MLRRPIIDQVFDPDTRKPVGWRFAFTDPATGERVSFDVDDAFLADLNCEVGKWLRTVVSCIADRTASGSG